VSWFPQRDGVDLDSVGNYSDARIDFNPVGKMGAVFTQHERDKLLLAVAGIVARDRRQRGVKLNYPEATAIIATQIMEWARDGKSITDVVALAGAIISEEEVMEGVASLIPSVQVEATFPDGTKLVTVHHPIR
jgi:urease gamma subunit